MSLPLIKAVWLGKTRSLLPKRSVRFPLPSYIIPFVCPIPPAKKKNTRPSPHVAPPFVSGLAYDDPINPVNLSTNLILIASPIHLLSICPAAGLHCSPSPMDRRHQPPLLATLHWIAGWAPPASSRSMPPASTTPNLPALVCAAPLCGHDVSCYRCQM